MANQELKSKLEKEFFERFEQNKLRKEGKVDDPLSLGDINRQARMGMFLDFKNLLYQKINLLTLDSVDVDVDGNMMIVTATFTNGRPHLTLRKRILASTCTVHGAKAIAEEIEATVKGS